MSELRKSTAPTVKVTAPAVTTTVEAPKAEAKPKAVKATKVAKATVAAIRTKEGALLRCTVLMGTKQCENPARHEVGKGRTCSTHERVNRRRPGTLKFTALKAEVNTSLWKAG